MTEPLTSGVDKALQYLADHAARYENRLQRAEVSKLKAELMKNRPYWMAADLDSVRSRLRDLGMSGEDVRTVVDLVSQAQAGKQLVPNRFYRDFKFNHSQD